MEFSGSVDGFSGLAKALRDLPQRVGKNILRSAVGAGAAVIRVEAKNNALRMKDTGTLARSIYQKQIRERSGPTNQTFFIGARSGKRYQKVSKTGRDLSRDAYYARWVELGHFTRGPGKGKLLRDANRGGKNNELLAFQVRTGAVRWVPAKPFLRPAFDVQKDRAVEAMAQKIRDRLVEGIETRS